ncbi:YafY family protein [Lacinutrix sp. 5H-3-7-4]|uniref:helix-turn-helix transcriptional regulator n=1 Tax=Lacinutrix sp. (strain 5H-3-7-4) TaxID=983544 RepID=UPI00020A3D67|nr:WYL domain-containing protein [Lacinutrix sp. 5H-3-7-4]AEG99878.1 hypothetical protein Lacal_0026 [Lacinutrix sp. 5H-3-7-4]
MTPDFIRKYHIYKLLVKTSITNCISRKAIIQSLENTYYNFHEGDKLYQGLLITSEKTVLRAIKDIELFFGVEIIFVKHKGHYMASDTVLFNEHRAIFDKMELFLASHKQQHWSPYITTEKSSLNTNINILGLVKAIEKNIYITITYMGWYDDDNFTTIKEATVQPLHIKESNKAWYLLVYNKNIGVKVLCLDSRVSNLFITNKIIEEPYIFSEASYFKNAFGILNDDTKVEKIVLKVANHHFKYLKSKKLHHSQQILSYPKKLDTQNLDYTDADIFGEISLFLKPNFEFLIELFKYNLWIKVIEPQWLAQKIVSQHQFILDKYYTDIQL